MDAIWEIDKEELKFNDPPEIAGRGTFGLVVKAEYRGTIVAVKRVILPKERVNRNATFLEGGNPNTKEPQSSEVKQETGHFGDRRPVRATSFEEPQSIRAVLLEEPQSITSAFFGDPHLITVTTPITDAKIPWTT